MRMTSSVSPPICSISRPSPRTPGWADGLSSAACAALSGLYRQASQELAATVDGLPAAVLNRAPDHPDDPTPRARDAGGSRSGVPADCTPDPRDGADR